MKKMECANVAMGAVFVAAVAASAAFAAEPVELAVRGKTPSLAIVLPENPGATEKYAAEELQSFLEKVTGAKLNVVSRKSGVSAPAKGVFIEKISSGLGDDGFRLKAEDGSLRIIGGKRGVLYGVYEVLEKYAGCRWYASWHSVIPEKDRVAVPGDLDDTQKPAFLMRESYWYDVNNNRDFAARLRVNGYNHTTGTVDAKYGGDDFRFGGGLGSCHTFEALLPQGVYFDKHPEYYSLVKGKRLRGRTQLCLTNPDVLRIVTSNVLERIRKDPGAKFYGVSQNDWYNFCECEKCAAVDKEEESHAGTMVRFVNAIAEAVEKEFPNAVIETLAYQYTRKPPKKTRLRRNVMPCLCTIECDFTRPIPENPYGENVRFMSDINGWKTQTDQLYLWDYTTEFQDFALPFPNVYALQGNIKFFRENNVKELFEQGDQCGRHGAFAELKAWLLAKFMWNPDQPIEPLLDDFFAGYYGKAAPFVREYFEEVHRRMRAWSPAKGPMRIWRSEAFRGLGGDFVEWAKPVWDKAEAAVKDDRAISYNVRMTRFSFDYLHLEKTRNKAQRLFSFVTGGPVDDGARLRRTQALAKSMLDRMDEAKDISLSESRHRHNAILAAWRGLVARKPVTYVSDKLGRVEDKYMTLHKEGTWGARVDDPLAEDGKALKLFNSHFEWCVGFSAGCVEFKPGVKYNVRARIRVEKARDGGEAFWAGVYNPVDKHLSRMIQPRTEAVKDGGYVWYDVATWTPRADGAEYFWLGPGRFGPDGKSSIKAVYLDKIEITRAD